MTEDRQAPPRAERLTVMLTAEEKRAYRFVSDARGMTESDLARAMTTEQVMAEYERIRAAIEQAA